MKEIILIRGPYSCDAPILSLITSLEHNDLLLVLNKFGGLPRIKSLIAMDINESSYQATRPILEYHDTRACFLKCESLEWIPPPTLFTGCAFDRVSDIKTYLPSVYLQLHL